MDAGCAGRIAGYHLTALGLMVADPQAEHARACLLGAQEREFQIHGLAGRCRELPDQRVHEVFQARVRAHPQALAVVHGDQRWTYQDLNTRANQLARALRARGLDREGVVAVVTDRTLDWMAAVLAIFKAGGVYLPLEPQFPPDRIATILSRAHCQLVVTQPGATTSLDTALAALPGVEQLLVDTAYTENHPHTDLGIDVTADQLAYIYFTSGSTGEPKGAMCEHAGLLNHLYAKIDDLQISPGHIVAQTAPQCFDISLWQLLSALLVGGHTLIINHDTILDVARFVDTIVDGHVTVLQVVPSYLDVVVSYLQTHPQPLPDLRYVSVTGEALKKELTQRWFHTQPHIPLVNAYGLTETSDDTNHEILTRPPHTDRVPLGPPVNNVALYIVDDHLTPVPLGAPGAIVFSGICVGRGYINDPHRTHTAYQPDPHRPGQRLYRGGDYGRWLPNGKLDFLGRRDTQVKISGFRIETGEIENTLLHIPGIRDTAVVVVTHPTPHLVAFYTGPHPLPPTTLREHLNHTLPHYMIPPTLHWQPTLPLTPNSKIDKKTLTALAHHHDTHHHPDTHPDNHHPSTPTEHRLTTAWATVLGIPAHHINRHDHFFDRGGTSLTAVKLAITLNRAITLTDLTHHPILADLAHLIDSRPTHPTHTTTAVPVPTGGCPSR